MLIPYLVLRIRELLVALLPSAALLLVIAMVSRVAADFMTQWSIRWAAGSGAVAEVNERSSHSEPVVRVGGIGIAAGLMVGFAVIAAMIAVPMAMPSELSLIQTTPHQWFASKELIGFIAAVAIAFAVGLWDDLKSIKPGMKLAGQVVAAIVPALCGLHIDKLHLPGMEAPMALPIAISFPLTVVWLVLMMNAVNFMDGINGLAGRFAQIVAIFAFLGVFGFGGAETMLPLAAALYGASDGFLKHNFPRAKTFMGDCGSQMLGMYIGVLGVHISQMPMNFPPPIIGFVLIVSLFLFDVIFTIIARAARGKNVTEAHRDHLYQKFLVANGENHEATLHFVDGDIFGLGVVGAAYLHFAFAGRGSLAILGIEATVLQLALIAVAAGILGHYAWRATQRAESKVDS